MTFNELKTKIEDWPNMFSDGKTNFIPVRDVLDLIDGALEQEPCNDAVSIEQSAVLMRKLYEEYEHNLEQIRAEFINKYPKNYANEPELGGRSCVFSLNEVLQIIDKYTRGERDESNV